METIGEFLAYVIGGRLSKKVVHWPPDAFACAAALLEKSGAYTAAVSVQWPPCRTRKQRAKWNSEIKKTGAAWRKTSVKDAQPPKPIQEAWETVRNGRDFELSELFNDGAPRKVCHALLEILAAADDACEGAGIPGEDLDDFQLKCLAQLESQSESISTLCKRISPSRFSVLPKLHTPLSGITIRSLSHHLALCAASEVTPQWYHIDNPELNFEDRYGVNVLLVPWPKEIVPTHFSPCTGPLENMDGDKFGFFRFEHREPDFDLELLKALVQKAREKGGSVDIIVFPELSLREEDLEKLSEFIEPLQPRPIVIGGMAIESGSAGEMDRNVSITLMPIKGGQIYYWMQDKHHRWLVTGDQVKQYGLGGVLDPTKNWWEFMQVGPRELGFFCVGSWLTFCTLICEDLARPDPVARIVRAVGPNLVFALLMDGPQLSTRWPARYGTVLADDPGSSVLTVSPVGMVTLSRPPGKAESRVVGLWKDARSSSPVEIELPRDSEAVLLAITSEFRNEHTADGRSDENSTAYLTLSGVHPIKP